LTSLAGTALTGTALIGTALTGTSLTGTALTGLISDGLALTGRVLADLLPGCGVSGQRLAGGSRRPARLGAVPGLITRALRPGHAIAHALVVVHVGIEPSAGD